MTRMKTSLVVPLLCVTFLIARPALAGPPLLCHPFDINGAASLPWGTASSWSARQPGYDLSRLVSDTDTLLAPATPVVVRMETLRRAVIYAAHDPKVAAHLLETFTRKVHDTNATRTPDPLRYLDAAYVIEALRQIGMFNADSEFGDNVVPVRDMVRDLDGYALMSKALLVRAGDPAFEFAAALIASQNHRGEYAQHAQRARERAASDPLVSRNLKQLM